MSKVVIASIDSQVAAELVTMAKSFGAQAVLVAFTPQQADELASCGADTLLAADIADAAPETCAKSLAEVIKQQQADLVAVDAGARGRDLAAQLAGYLDAGLGADAVNIALEDGAVTYQRNVYGGNAVTDECIAGLAVLTMGKGCYEPTSGAVAATEQITLTPDARVTVVSREEIKHEGVDIAAADCVVGIGMGMTDQGQMATAQDLADAMDGALGCSRGIAEERNWLPTENYIGISGRVIKPKLYLTLGISGQVQHLYGVRDAQVIACVNTDENAPIFKNADYGIVGDLNEYAPLIAKAIREL